MTEDSLSKVSRKASGQLRSLKSPCQFETEETETVQPRTNTCKEVKRIALENDEKIVDVLKKIVREGLAKRR